MEAVQQIKLKSVPLYFEKFLSSLDVKAMSTREVGAYFLLLANSVSQDDQGYLNVDEEGLRNIVKLSESEWEKDRKRIMKKFKHCERGYYNEAMVRAIEKQIQIIVADMNSNKIVDVNEKIDLTPENNSGLHPLQEYVEKHFTNIKKMHNQLTFMQCEKLIKGLKFSDKLIISKLVKMENTVNIHNRYTSIFLTLKDWCEKELKR